MVRSVPKLLPTQRRWGVSIGTGRTDGQRNGRALPNLTHGSRKSSLPNRSSSSCHAQRWEHSSGAESEHMSACAKCPGDRSNTTKSFQIGNARLTARRLVANARSRSNLTCTLKLFWGAIKKIMIMGFNWQISLTHAYHKRSMIKLKLCWIRKWIKKR